MDCLYCPNITFILFEKRRRYARKNQLMEVGREALIETHSLGAERVLGVFIAELRAEWGSRIYRTEVRAVAPERIIHAGYAFCILGSINAVWSGERFFPIWVRTFR
jgi:hypothetical protein